MPGSRRPSACGADCLSDALAALVKEYARDRCSHRPPPIRAGRPARADPRRRARRPRAADRRCRTCPIRWRCTGPSPGSRTASARRGPIRSSRSLLGLGMPALMVGLTPRRLERAASRHVVPLHWAPFALATAVFTTVLMTGLLLMQVAGGRSGVRAAGVDPPVRRARRSGDRRRRGLVRTAQDRGEPAARRCRHAAAARAGGAGGLDAHGDDVGRRDGAPDRRCRPRARTGAVDPAQTAAARVGVDHDRRRCAGSAARGRDDDLPRHASTTSGLTVRSVLGIPRVRDRPTTIITAVAVIKVNPMGGVRRLGACG